MKQSRDNLLQLIRLMDGQLPPEDEQFLRTQLVADESLRKKYKRLSDLSAVSSLELPYTPTSSGVDEEMLAAFVDDRLGQQEADRVESACWDSPSLLSTVVSTYRFARRDLAELDVVVPERLTRRLKMLVPASHVTPTETSADDTGNDLIDDTVFPGVSESAVPVPVPVVVCVTESDRRQRHSSRLVVGVALAVMAALALGMWYVGNGDPDRSQMVEDVAPAPQVEQPRNDNVSPEPQQKSPANNVVQVPDNQPQNPVGPPQKVDPTTSVPPVVHQRPKPVPRSPRQDRSIQWVQTAGVIARRDEGSPKWVGLEYGTPGPGTTTYSTLPGSWAEAEFRQGFSLVLDADTEVRIPEDDAAGALVDLELSHGRLALRSLDQDQVVRVRLDPVTWSLKAADGQTALGLVWSASRPTLFVMAGSVAVDGRKYGRGRQVTWFEGQFQDATSLNIATNWTKTPPDSAMLDAEWQQAMQVSNDLQATMLRFQSAQGAAGLTSVKWQCALSGGQYVSRVLGSKNARMRSLAVQWMLAVQPDDKRLQSVLDAVAGQAKDPKLPAQIRSWLRVARDPQKSQMRVAQQMINHLNAPQLAIRHISDQLLRQITGVSAKSYRPDATVAERRRGVQEWKRNVLRLRKSGKLR